MGDADLTCQLPACTVGADGRCLAGYARLADCPHAGGGPGGSGAGGRELSSTAPEQALEDEGAWLELADGGDLDTEAAERIARAGIARVVVLLGAADSGKTTLLASLYESFQHGRFAGYAFGGSETLSGFERRCHLARVDSGRATAETARTLATSGQRWLHLRLRAGTHGIARDVLFAEVASDVFRLAKDSTEECRRLSLARRADHFVILVDGGKLAHRQHRLTATNDAALVLRSCLDAEVLGESSLVDVVFAKWDVVMASAVAAEAEEFVTGFAEKTRQHCEARLGRLRFSRVAARPAPNSPTGYAHGVPELVASWIEESPASRRRAWVPVAMPRDASEFDRYLVRRLPALAAAGPRP